MPSKTSSANAAIIAANVLLAISSIVVPGKAVWAQTFTWSGGSGTDTRWENSLNWNSHQVPNSATDVVLGPIAITPNYRIDAEGSQSVVTLNPPTFMFVDPQLTANSLTINTLNAFTLDGQFNGTFLSVPTVSGKSTLTLNNGDLTRQDLSGDEGDHFFDLIVRLASDGLWNVGGSGALKVFRISAGDPHTFTKTGTGTLETSLNLPGAKTISQGKLKGTINGTGSATIAAGAVFHATGVSFSPITLNGLPNSLLFTSMIAGGSGNPLLHLNGQLTVVNNPRISVDPGNILELNGGITDSGSNYGFSFNGSGELEINGPGTFSGNVSTIGGQLTVAHNTALGTGQVFVSDTSGGVNIPSLAFRNGVTFSNPISLRRGRLRGLDNNTVTSNITLDGLVASNNTLDVPDANHTLTLNGNITQTGSGFELTKTGAGAVVLGGNTTASGGVNVAEGVLANNGAIIASATHVTGNARLAGSGQFGDVNVADNGTFAPGSTTSASDFSSASVMVEDLIFTGTATTLEIQLGGLSPGIGFDQLLIGGNATLGGTLVVSLAEGFSLAAGQSFLVLDVAETLNGQFAGTSEGLLVGTFGGTDLFITYAAGDGNDVALFTTATSFQGDYNDDGVVNAADYVKWRDHLGSGASLPNDSTAGVDAGDYLVWRANFGAAQGSGSSENVVTPEPTSMLLAALCLAGLMAISRQEASCSKIAAP